MDFRRYTESDFKEAVSKSTSIRQALKILKLKPAGGNYQTFKRAVIYFKLDTSHFKGQGWKKEKIVPSKRPLSDYLNKGVPIQSNKLRLRLLKEKVFEHLCSNCNLSTWQNKPIPLELDHINGNNQDNQIDNLRLLCPNCHALTDTYRGKNINKR